MYFFKILKKDADRIGCVEGTGTMSIEAAKKFLELVSAEGDEGVADRMRKALESNGQPAPK